MIISIVLSNSMTYKIVFVVGQINCGLLLTRIAREKKLAVARKFIGLHKIMFAPRISLEHSSQLLHPTRLANEVHLLYSSIQFV